MDKLNLCFLIKTPTETLIRFHFCFNEAAKVPIGIIISKDQILYPGLKVIL